MILYDIILYYIKYANISTNMQTMQNIKKYATYAQICKNMQHMQTYAKICKQWHDEFQHMQRFANIGTMNANICKNMQPVVR